MPDDRARRVKDRVKDRIEALLASDGVLAAAVVSRDGICLESGAKRPFGIETFSAMVATAMGAAETAIFEVGGKVVKKMEVEGDAGRLVLVGATDELLLVVLVSPGTSASSIGARLDEAARGLAEVAR